MTGMVYEFRMDQAQESLGSIVDACSAPYNMDNMLMIGRVLDEAESIEDPVLKAKTVNFVTMLWYHVGRSKIGFKLPRIVTDFQRTDSYMEWVFLHFRFGFNVSSDDTQDGWFILTDDSLGDLEASHHRPAPLDQVIEFVERFGDDRV